MSIEKRFENIRIGGLEESGVVSYTNYIPISKAIILCKQIVTEKCIGLLEWMNEINKTEPMRLETDFEDIVQMYLEYTRKGTNK